MIANMTCVCIVGIEVGGECDSKYDLHLQIDQLSGLMYIIPGSGATRGSRLDQAVPESRHHRPYGHRGQHQHRQGNRH